MAEVAAGASVIIQQCANKERNQGGLAMDISKLLGTEQRPRED